MADKLPVGKSSKVWVQRRKNNPKKDTTRTVSYTLVWVE